MADDLNLDLDLDLDLDLGNLDLDLGGDPVDPNSLGASIGRGIDNMQGNIYKSLEVAADAVGAEDLQEWARTGAVKNYEDAMEYGTPIQMKDVDSLADAWSFIVSRGGELAPAIAGYTIAAGGGTLLGGPAGGVAATAAYGGAQNVGDVARVAEDKGDEFSAAHLAQAGLMTAVDLFAVSRATKPFMKTTMQQAVKDLGEKGAKEGMEKGLLKIGVKKEIAQNLAVVSTAEAMAATANVALLEAGTSALAGTEVSDDIYWQMAEAALLGGSAGAGIGSVGGFYKAKAMERFISPETARKAAGLLDEEVGEGNILSKTWKTVTGKPLDAIAPIITKSKAGRFIRDTLQNTLEATKRDRTAKQLHKLTKIREAAEAEFGKGWETELSKAMRDKDSTSEAAKLMRKTMDEDFQESVAMGLVKKEDYIEGYNPSKMDKRKILDDKESFEADLRKEGVELDGDSDKAIFNREKLIRYYKALEEDNWAMFQNRFERLSEGDMQGEFRRAKMRELEGDISEEKVKGRIRKERVTGKHGNIEGHRVWDTSQNFYDKWSVDENLGKGWWKNVVSYNLRSAHRKAAVDHIGKNGEKLNKKIFEMQDELFNSDNPVLLTSKELDRIYNTVAAYDGNYNRMESKFWRDTANVVGVIANTSALPLVTLSSLTEWFNVAMKTDMSTAVKATTEVLSHAGYEAIYRAFNRKPSDRHLTRRTQASMAGQTIFSADLAIEARLTDPGMSDWAAGINRKFFKMNGLTYWTQFIRNVSAEAARLQIQQDITTIHNFKDSHPKSGEVQRARARLAELGIGPVKYKTLSDPKPTPELQQKVDVIMGEAINKFNREVSLEPSFADRPLWMSDQKMWWLTRLQGYPTMFTNTVLPMLFNKVKGSQGHAGVIDGMFILGGIAMVGGMQMGIKDLIAGREIHTMGGEEMNFLEVGAQALNKYASPKPIAQAYGMLSGQQYGRTAADTAVGITGSLANDVVSPMFKVMDGRLNPFEAAMDTLINLTPARALKSRLQGD